MDELMVALVTFGSVIGLVVCEIAALSMGKSACEPEAGHSKDK